MRYIQVLGEDFARPIAEPVRYYRPCDHYGSVEFRSGEFECICQNCGQELNKQVMKHLKQDMNEYRQDIFR